MSLMDLVTVMELLMEWDLAWQMGWVMELLMDWESARELMLLKVSEMRLAMVSVSQPATCLALIRLHSISGLIHL